MKFHSRMVSDYPKAVAMLKRRVPAVAYSEDIWRVFKKWSNLSEQAAQEAVSIGTKPEVRDAPMRHGTYGNYSGTTRPKGIDMIFISQQVLRWYEHCEANRNNILFEKFLRGIVLHELCHWGEYLDRVDGPVEEGNEFEKEAFGHRLGHFKVWETQYEKAVQERRFRAESAGWVF